MKISFPQVGYYTDVIKFLLDGLECDYMMPPPITQKTIKLGSKYSAEMMCLEGDTEITLEDYTSKPIKEIKSGDKVLTHKGRFRKVTKTFSREYNGKILNVECGGLLKLKITPDHPILTLKREKIKQKIFIPDFIQANELEKKDFLAIPIPKETKNFTHLDWKKEYFHNSFKYKNTKFNYSPKLLRVLGYWLAEGSIIYNRRENKKTSGIDFTFSSKESSYIKEVEEIIKSNFNCSISTRSQKLSVLDIMVFSKSLADIFLYLCGEYCYGKVIHKDIMNLDPKLQLELLRGYLRGDGCFNLNKKDKRYSSTTVSKKLANQLFWLLVRNYIKPGFSTRSVKNRRKSYYLRLWKGEITKFEEVLISLIRRTYPHHIKTENYIFTPIKKITKEDYDGKVYNLEVKEDNSYISNCLVVHNCMPFKVTLGTFIEALDKGADALLMVGQPRTSCRLRHYHILQKQILEDLGYKFKMVRVSFTNFLPTFKKLSGKSYFEVMKQLKKSWEKLKEIEEEHYSFERKYDVSIGITGEIYTCLENSINFNIIEKFRKMGVNVHMSIPVSSFLRHIYKIDFKKLKYKREAAKYVFGKVGGHGFESIYNLLWYANNDFDGVIHLLPLSCGPEQVVYVVLDRLAQKHKIPLMHLPIDEAVGEVGFDTRIEAFVEMLKRKKK